MNDEYMLDTPALRDFIGQVQAIKARAQSIPEALAALRPHFSKLLADPTWLPDAFRQPDAASGMGGGIATWLIYRAGDSSLSLFALVVPPGVATPIHDHLAWGLVGLYVGEQMEEVFAPVDDADDEAAAPGKLRLTATNHLRAGEFYELIPPRDDIHRVTTTSLGPSVSLHLLGNDTGCVWRHRYELETSTIQPFRSGYTNRACPEHDR